MFVCFDLLICGVGVDLWCWCEEKMSSTGGIALSESGGDGFALWQSGDGGLRSG